MVHAAGETRKSIRARTDNPETCTRIPCRQSFRWALCVTGAADQAPELHGDPAAWARGRPVSLRYLGPGFPCPGFCGSSPAADVPLRADWGGWVLAGTALSPPWPACAAFCSLCYGRSPCASRFHRCVLVRLSLPRRGAGPSRAEPGFLAFEPGLPGTVRAFLSHRANMAPPFAAVVPTQPGQCCLQVREPELVLCHVLPQHP